MSLCIGFPDVNNNIWGLRNIRLSIWGPAKKLWHEPEIVANESPLGSQTGANFIFKYYRSSLKHYFAELSIFVSCMGTRLHYEEM